MRMGYHIAPGGIAVLPKACESGCNRVKRPEQLISADMEANVNNDEAEESREQVESVQVRVPIL